MTTPEAGLPRSILFACHANTARSVMAEWLLRDDLTRRGLEELVAVRSVGVAAYARDSAQVSLDTRLALREQGVEIPPGTTATALKQHPELVDDADLILTMTHEQKQLLVAACPGAGHKPVYTLAEYVGGGGDIPDPSGEEHDVFRQVCRDIRCLTQCLADRLAAAAARAGQGGP